MPLGQPGISNRALSESKEIIRRATCGTGIGFTVRSPMPGVYAYPLELFYSRNQLLARSV